MSDTRTASILQRVPAILAVTANSYGLPQQSRGPQKPEAAAAHRESHARDKTGEKPVAHS